MIIIFYFLIFLTFILFLFFVLGLINPKISLFWYKKGQTRIKSSVIYGLSIFISVLLLFIGLSSYFSYYARGITNPKDSPIDSSVSGNDKITDTTKNFSRKFLTPEDLVLLSSHLKLFGEDSVKIILQDNLFTKYNNGANDSLLIFKRVFSKEDNLKKVTEYIKFIE